MQGVSATRRDSLASSGASSPTSVPTHDAVPGRLLALAAVVLAALWWPVAADARPTPFARGLASSYGPGLFGNRTACGQTLTPSTRGVAHRSLPCGTRLQICYVAAHRCTYARVTDRGPYSGARVLDLTAQTTRELCSCSPYVWGVRVVAYRRRDLP
jgi:rare lipoprotein A